MSCAVLFTSSYLKESSTVGCVSRAKAKRLTPDSVGPGL